MIYRKAAGIPILTSLISRTSSAFHTSIVHRRHLFDSRLMMSSYNNNDIKKDTTVYIVSKHLVPPQQVNHLNSKYLQ